MALLKNKSFSYRTPDGIAYQAKPDDPVIVIRKLTNIEITEGGLSCPTRGLENPRSLYKSKDHRNLSIVIAPELVKEIISTCDECLTYLAGRSKGGSQYYKDGFWHFKNEVLACEGGPAGMAAALWKWREANPDTMEKKAKESQPWLYKVAVETFERVIDDFQNPDGSLKNPRSHAIFLYVEMANTFLLLRDTFSAKIAKRWLKAMRKQAEFMMRKGEIPDPSKKGWQGTDGWYTNGNVEICEAEWLYMLWLATGDRFYKDLFEVQWKHVHNPDPVQWKGYGFFYLKYPKKEDGSDGKGYITERPSKDDLRNYHDKVDLPGFDYDYSQLQLSIAARLYLKSRDTRVLRVINLIFNAMRPHVDKRTMIMDGTKGSRHSTVMPFITCAPEILAWHGGRTDILSMVGNHFRRALKKPYLNNAKLQQGYPGLYRGYGYDLETVLESII